MTFRIAALAFAASTIFASQTCANGPIKFFHGADLHEMCQTQPQVATGYVIGAMDYSELLWWTNKPIDGQLCSNEVLNTGMIRDIVCRYVDQHQEQHDRSAASLVQRAMTEAFPCAAWVAEERMTYGED